MSYPKLDNDSETVTISRDEWEDLRKQVREIHDFLFSFAEQMQALGSNPMVKALAGNMGAGLGIFKRKGKSDGESV